MKLYWLDLESTGLDPGLNDILEIYVAVAKFEKPFEATPLYHAILCYNGEVSRFHPVVQEMHTRNGLWAECATSKTFLPEVEEALLGLIPDVSNNFFAGSSVHFDAAFLKKHMPRVAARFSHRVYDVSAMSLFARSLGMSPLPKSEAHRARADVEASIAQVKAIAAWFGKETL